MATDCKHVWVLISLKPEHSSQLVECIHCGERERA